MARRKLTAGRSRASGAEDGAHGHHHGPEEGGEMQHQGSCHHGTSLSGARDASAQSRRMCGERRETPFWGRGLT